MCSTLPLNGTVYEYKHPSWNNSLDCAIALLLTHVGRDKLVVIFQTAFEIFENCCNLKQFIWYLFLVVQLKITLIDPDNGLVPNRRNAIILTNGGLGYCRKYASPDHDKLNLQYLQLREQYFFPFAFRETPF